MYNLTHRYDDVLIDQLAEQGIAYVPFFPLGGFTPLQSERLSAVSEELGRRDGGGARVAPAAIPNILLIPGTSSTATPPRKHHRRGAFTSRGRRDRAGQDRSLTPGRQRSSGLLDS